MGWLVTQEGLEQLVRSLAADHTVYGPVVRDGVIAHDEISSIADLPAGWTEEQEAGTYRLVPSGTEELFAWASPSESWKRFVHPSRSLLVRARRADGDVHLDPTPRDARRRAFFGIRSCDLAALGVLDRVFLDPDATDPTYRARRSDVFVVAVACGHPGNTCFCASMDTGPSPRGGYDLAITELRDPHRFLVEAGSDRGAARMADVTTRAATPDDDAAAAHVVAEAERSMGRSLPPPVAARAGDHPTSPQWDDVAARCLACANCTMICPTCFCSSTEDTTDLTGTISERWRVWDSCFTVDFTHLPGGAVRNSTASRYRQWLLHKLVTWHDQFDTSGCVGCGRCITWCPVGIDITAEAARVAERAGVGDTAAGANREAPS